MVQFISAHNFGMFSTSSVYRITNYISVWLWPTYLLYTTQFRALLINNYNRHNAITKLKSINCLPNKYHKICGFLRYSNSCAFVCSCVCHCLIFSFNKCFWKRAAKEVYTCFVYFIFFLFGQNSILKSKPKPKLKIKEKKKVENNWLKISLTLLKISNNKTRKLCSRSSSSPYAHTQKKTPKLCSGLM